MAACPTQGTAVLEHGKDSAFTVVLATAEVDVVGLVSTINAGADRVAMHGVRRELLLRQADAVGLPVHEVNIPWPCSNEEYETAMSAVVAAAHATRASPGWRSATCSWPTSGRTRGARSTPDSDWTAFYPMSSGPPGRLPCGQRDAGQE